MNNTLTFFCRATNHNGFPLIKLMLDGVDLPAYTINQELFTVSVDLDFACKQRILVIERYGKTDHNVSVDTNGNIVKDQYFEILDVKIDDTRVPDFIMQSCIRFEFDNQCHPGSRFFGPNGIWTFEFETPFVQFVLDQKILHEAKFNNDYVYAWSYKLGPDSVAKLTNEINTVINKVENTL